MKNSFIISPWFPHSFPLVSHGFPIIFPTIFPWFRHDSIIFPSISWGPRGVTAPSGLLATEDHRDGTPEQLTPQGANPLGAADVVIRLGDEGWGPRDPQGLGWLLKAQKMSRLMVWYQGWLFKRTEKTSNLKFCDFQFFSQKKKMCQR